MTDPPSRLHDIDYPLLQDTSKDKLIADFYEPSLAVASEYKRAVGYFTSSWFAEAAAGMAEFAENGGTARWIISPKLSEDDWAAIKKGEAAMRDPELKSRMGDMVGDLRSDLQTDTKNTIAWMIADGLLEIKIAVTKGKLEGDFHDKWGILVDEHEDRVAFHGSQNDSRHSLSNYESNSIFASWRSDTDAARVDLHEDRFEQLWANDNRGVTCHSLPDSVGLEIAELRSEDRPYQDPGEQSKLASSYRWRHQERAVEAFLEAKGGILEMATGTGKTRTSLKILDELLSTDTIQTLVVATYGNDLLAQWEETLLDRFSPDEMLLYKQFDGHKQLSAFLRAETDEMDVLLTSYANLATAIEGDTRAKLSDALLICDEVHHLGASTKQADLAGRLDLFPYRLGLSATPFDPYDTDRNEFLRDEIGPVAFEFGLSEAIRRGILCEFEYVPLEYELSEQDRAEQKEVFRKFTGMKQQNPSIPQSQLYIMLARVRKESEEKLPVLAEHLEAHPEHLESCVIFVETKDFGLKVQKIIFDHIDEFHTYYGEDDERNLKAFSEGELSTLVTSKAISEGIDIQSIKNIILLTAPRALGQTKQRMGRALRRDPTNPNKKAKIVDFVVESTSGSGSGLTEDLADEESETDEMRPPDEERREWLTELSKKRQQ
jgi:superfamily II DNA or RNA helicase